MRTTKTADSFENFITELRTKAKACDFTASDEMIRDKIVFSINSIGVPERLLREPELSLVKAFNPLCPKYIFANFVVFD